MRNKLLKLILVITFLVLYRDASADDICYFSTPTQFGNCKAQNNSKLIPKYPLDSAKVGLLSEDNFISLGKAQFAINSGRSYVILRFRSEDGEKIEVTKAINKNSRWNYKKNPKSFFIKGENITSWKYELENTYSSLGFKTDVHSFDVNYIDEFGRTKTLSGISTMPRGRFGFLKALFEDISGLKNNEEKFISDVLLNKLKKNEKRIAIIQSIIKIPINESEGCFELSGTKFPDLAAEYKRLSKTIKPLRTKLNLPPSTDLKKICGEVPSGERPLWMEEKIKGCFKYPTKKQRDYCINVYSPYGKE